MEATELEFRYRVWIVALIFTAAFCCYFFDHRNTAEALTALLGGGLRAATALRVQHGVFAAGGLLAGAGAMLRTWGTAYLRADVMSDPELHLERLVAGGPYRHVRNPLYLGNILVAAGLVVMLSPTGSIVMVLGMGLFMLRLLTREEAALLEAQGDGYLRYCAAVPRLVPALAPRVPPGDRTPRWVEGLLAEVFFWGLAASVLAFAVTYDARLFYGILIGSLVAELLARPALRRRGREAPGPSP